METIQYFIEKNGIKYFHFHRTLVHLKMIGKQKFGEDFKFYKEDEEILEKLFLYFIHDPTSCAEKGIDIKKGILLVGPVGCGKTTLMKLFLELAQEKMKYIVRPTRDITAEFIEDGFSVLSKYGLTYKGFCFDDLGVEQSIKHFGNECNVIAEILLTRYEYLKTHNRITHATTNLNANDLEKIYGNRVRSRLREMFNVITFPSTTPDKRK
jgi:DNA replication protein DnaC